MGSTYVDFHGQGFEASDATLEVWLLLLVDEIDRLENSPPWLKEIREEWYIQGTAGFGFGVMPGLDQFVTGPECRETIIDLSVKAMRRLRALGPWTSSTRSCAAAREPSLPNLSRPQCSRRSATTSLSSSAESSVPRRRTLVSKAR